jgi:hypothetical protein
VTGIDTAGPPTWFTIDDGSGAIVKCSVPSGVTIDPNWQFVGVTGISSCEKVGEELYRLLRVRQQSDIDEIKQVVPLGNPAIPRSYASNAQAGSDYMIADVSPGWTLAAPGHLDSWHIYADVRPALAQDQEIDLMVWRPVGGLQYQLIVRDRVLVTAGNGLKDIAASASAKAKLIQPGDVLGFYIPVGASSVIAMDYYDTHPMLDPYFAPGGSQWVEGQTVPFTGVTFERDYSLYAEIAP